MSHDTTQEKTVPLCPYCGEVFARLGMLEDAGASAIIFFCLCCGKALGAQLLKTAAEDAP